MKKENKKYNYKMDDVVMYLKKIKKQLAHHQKSLLTLIRILNGKKY